MYGPAETRKREARKWVTCLKERSALRNEVTKGLSGFVSNAKAHWLGLVGYKTQGPADIRRPIEQSFL